MRAAPLLAWTETPVEDWFAFAALSLAVAGSPGPSWAYVLSATLGEGRTGGAVAIAGNATGILLHTAAAAAGLAALIAQSADLFRALRWAGAAYLLFLAVRTFRSSGAQLATSAEPAGAGKIFVGGVLMSVLNPKIILLLLALLPQFVDPARGSAALQAAGFGALHASIASLTLVVVSFAAHAANSRFRSDSGFGRWLRWISAGALGGFGLRMALGR